MQTQKSFLEVADDTFSDMQDGGDLMRKSARFQNKSWQNTCCFDSWINSVFGDEVCKCIKCLLKRKSKKLCFFFFLFLQLIRDQTKRELVSWNSRCVLFVFLLSGWETLVAAKTLISGKNKPHWRCWDCRGFPILEAARADLHEPSVGGKSKFCSIWEASILPISPWDRVAERKAEHVNFWERD